MILSMFLLLHKSFARSASVISQEVPQAQIDFFYRQLHRLLDAALDKHDEDLDATINEERFRDLVSSVLNEQDENDEDDEDLGADRALTIENPDVMEDIVRYDYL